LAVGLAGWIAANIDVMKLESRGRTLQAGDILILVRSRNEFGPALTRALKDAGVPVAGLDRMVLTETRAVADLVALAQAVLLPEDDVAVATVLASPLGGLSDDQLMALAIGRGGTLRDALFARADETPEYRAARDFFAAVQARADFVSPYRLFAEVLGTLGGLRAALIEAEAALTGGAAPRVSPFPELADCAGLLQRAGFALPIAERETIDFDYADPLALLRDLRDAGETKAPVARARRPPHRRGVAGAPDAPVRCSPCCGRNPLPRGRGAGPVFLGGRACRVGEQAVIKKQR
jgi:hypothetical protein